MGGAFVMCVPSEVEVSVEGKTLCGTSACSLKTRWIQGTEEHREEEKGEFGFGPAGLQILLLFEDINMKVKKELGAKIRVLEINLYFLK